MTNIRNIARAAFPVAALIALPLGIDSGIASAAAPAATRVTIDRAGSDLFGTVSSSRPSCEGNRKVVLFKQRGTRGGGDDVRVASDTSEVQSGVGVWSTGNTGLAGKFYAKVTKTALCNADFSPTITVPED
ncbi:hypothetical protein [Nocardioides bizhenqiangii]|uniref:Uncharacterized protein n=1 Tax=Nocardioides bizhenqiangii TaxID=3095076 RepID=A0ABZ0ZRM9_9ACTN|nr:MULTISPECIES: hypothetical protein [unclassified Nocardioides]MDZ5619456.1 hypothetical protein [Nocardioides sp. HM23]WQQ26524.1 hypothetical protein SHK19_21540 [Nocardioides sp. HM61]